MTDGVYRKCFSNLMIWDTKIRNHIWEEINVNWYYFFSFEQGNFQKKEFHSLPKSALYYALLTTMCKYSLFYFNVKEMHIGVLLFKKQLFFRDRIPSKNIFHNIDFFITKPKISSNKSRMYFFSYAKQVCKKIFAKFKKRTLVVRKRFIRLCFL